PIFSDNISGPLYRSPIINLQHLTLLSGAAEVLYTSLQAFTLKSRFKHISGLMQPTWDNLSEHSSLQKKEVMFIMSKDVQRLFIQPIRSTQQLSKLSLKKAHGFAIRQFKIGATMFI